MKGLIFLFLSLFIALPVAHAHPEKIRIIKLEQKNTDTISHYHIVSVIDDRIDTSNIGFIRSSAFLNSKMVANLENGVTTSVTGFLSQHVLQDNNTPSVELHITKLSISERPEAIKEHATLKLGMAFYINGKFVTEYNGKSGITATDATLFLSELIRKSIVNTLKEFDNWMEQNK